jgi:sugar lactone lactonase YvrE
MLGEAGSPDGGEVAMRDPVKARFEVLDERFRSYRGDRWLECLHAGCRWTEGPAYFPAGRYLVFSDIPNDRILRWDEATGAVGVFRQPAGYANGHTVDRQGRLVSCEQGPRRVTRTEHDGSVTVLAGNWDGKRLNSPNDIVERADGSLWFTDPAYGIDSDYEGFRADSEIGACYVYRLDPASGAMRVVADDFDRPNGLAFSADERTLYIVDSARRHLRVFGGRRRRAHRRRGLRDLHRRQLRRHPPRRPRPHLGRGRRRAALLRPGRHAARKAPRARGRGQLHLRRRQAQSVVSLRDQLGVLDPGQLQRRRVPALTGPVRSRARSGRSRCSRTGPG